VPVGKKVSAVVDAEKTQKVIRRRRRRRPAGQSRSVSRRQCGPTV